MMNNDFHTADRRALVAYWQERRARRRANFLVTFAFVSAIFLIAINL